MITQENIPYTADEIKAMVKTCEKYNKALERAKDMLAYKEVRQEDMEYLFPELKESEDERIRKGLIKAVSRIFEGNKLFDTDVTREEALAWLEKQGEDKHTDKVEPKFKVRDWCIDNEDGVIFQIVKVLDNTYTYRTNEGKEYSCTHYSLENDVRLWTIQDAKDGDVLINWNNTTFIFKAIEDETVKFHIAYNEKWDTIKTPSTKLSHLGLPEPQFEFHPATKEQHELLFQKMKEAGYEWDSEKKELKKIEVKTLDADDILPYLGNNQVQDILEDMGMLDDNGRCPHTAEEIFKAGMEHAFNLNREAASSVKLDADKVIEWLKKTIRAHAENYGVYKATRLTLPYNSIEDFINDFKEDFGL